MVVSIKCWSFIITVLSKVVRSAISEGCDVSFKSNGNVITLRFALQSADTSVCQDMSLRHCAEYRPPQTNRAGTAIGTVRWTETTESRVTECVMFAVGLLRRIAESRTG